MKGVQALTSTSMHKHREKANKNKYKGFFLSDYYGCSSLCFVYSVFKRQKWMNCLRVLPPPLLLISPSSSFISFAFLLSSLYIPSLPFLPPVCPSFLQALLLLSPFPPSSPLERTRQTDNWIHNTTHAHGHTERIKHGKEMKSSPLTFSHSGPPVMMTGDNNDETASCSSPHSVHTHTQIR